MTSLAGTPWLDAAWLPGPEERVGDIGSVEARLPAIRAAAREEAHGPLHANITLFSLLTSSGGGGGQRNLGHLHFEVRVNGAMETNVLLANTPYLFVSASRVLICNCRWSICIYLC